MERITEKEMENSGRTTYVPELNTAQHPIGENIIANLAHIKRIGEAVVNHFYSPKGIAINIWVTGSSGLIIGTIISGMLIDKGYDTRMCHVKKEGETSHSFGINYKRWGEDVAIKSVFVDDFIATGATYDRVCDKFTEITETFSFDLVALVQNGIGGCMLDRQETFGHIIIGEPYDYKRE